MNMELISQ